MSKLGKAQESFSFSLTQLLSYIHSKGFKVRMGDGFAVPCPDCGYYGHKQNSNHGLKLAEDLNIFDQDGKMLTKTEQHKEFGDYWEHLHENNPWGGRYGDGNHYEHCLNGFKR